MHQQEAISTDNYLTLKNPGEGLYKEKGSKFIAFAYPANSVEEAMEHVADLKTKFHDARHWCFGYRITPLQPQIRANDDGEPSNSAGTPIYNQIASADLWNTIVIVVRYFGGTKLGVSGLINAYKEAAAEALKNATTKRVFIMEQVEVEFPYSIMNDVMRLIKDMELQIVEEKMGINAGYVLATRKDHFDEMIKKLELMHLLKIKEDIL